MSDLNDVFAIVAGAVPGALSRYHINSITTQFSNIFNNYNYHHHLEENYKKNYLQVYFYLELL